MARSLSQTLTRFSPLSNSLSTAASTTRLINFRHRSNSPEINSVEFPVAEDTEKVAINTLEDEIHNIIVKRSQPDWIPLVPGASYWVPPRSKAHGYAKVIRKLVHCSAATARMKGHTNKSVSLSSSRGWPSSAHYFKGGSHSPMEGETTSKYASQSEDEEG
ncbi:hypothetical protein SOVF_112130 [Spinacia oleracea]|nr:hypothetical protein SOVF_112130 [Spinacia oleracea]